MIKVDAPGVKEALDRISGSLGNITKNTKSLASNMNILKNAFGGYLSALGLREIARMSDEMQNLSHRIKIVSRAGEDSNAVMGELLKLANDTQQSVSNVGEVYARLGSSLKAVNASSGTMLEITKALINSFRISGSTNNETTATIIQLSQAFASGTLRGQELRSVMLQNAELASLLRERFGKNLAKDAEAGLISIVEVMKLLRANQDRINESAKVLAPTFEQTLTKALNKVQFALFQLNNEFKLSAKFAIGVEAISSRMSLLLTIVGVLALTQIPALIASLKALNTAMLIIATKNPLTVALLAISAVVLATNDSLDSFIDKLRNVGAWLVQVRIWVLEASFAIEKSFAKGIIALGAGSKGIVEELARDLDEIRDLKKIAEGLGTPSARAPSPLDPNKNKSDAEFQGLLDNLNKLYGAGEKLKKTKEILGEINREFLAGVTSIQEYDNKLQNFELYKLNREFREGKFDVFKYNERLREIDERELDRKFKSGAISVTEFNDAISNLKIDELTKKFEAGRISLIDYNAELTNISRKFEPGSALITGTNSFLESIGTVSSNMADGIRTTFGHLEDNLVEFIRRGKFNFADFTRAILDDLTRIIIRATIIRPLAEGILGVATGGGGGSEGLNNFNTTPGSAVAAKGLAFDKGIRRFASGGIVDSPTMFGYGKGKTGLMGEAGPEAILPLKRGSGGNLGVSATVTPVYVNIINQSGNEVEERETAGPNGERMIEVLVTNKVREGIVSGKFDKAMKSSYGLSRKGS